MTRVYFTDRDLGKRFGEILRLGGLTVEHHADHFAPDTPDEVWLAEIGKRGWIALTHDRRIRYKPNEREAVMQHRVALLVIIGAAPFPDLARAFVATVPVLSTFLPAIGRHSLQRCIVPRRATPLRAIHPVGLSSGIRDDDHQAVCGARSHPFSSPSASGLPTCPA